MRMPWSPPLPPGTPPWSTLISEAPLLALDIETTGLNPREHRIVSIGWLPVNGLEIDLSQPYYGVLAGSEVGESALVHGLTDDDVALGLDPAQVLEDLMAALKGRMMLVHYEAIETQFLAHLHKQVTGRAIEFPAVDTFAIERRHMERMSTYPRGEDLRLARVRQRYGLASYPNHNALTDALACAELYLAQMAYTRATTLGQLRY